MQVAMEYERQQGRTPVDVSAENRGYDIRSEAPDGSVRYIEVKARAYTGDLVLTPNEWTMAQRLGDEYWLYVVIDAARQPHLQCIQNPAQSLRPTQFRASCATAYRWKSGNPSPTEASIDERVAHTRP
jgi:hypothetical protein